MTPPIVSGLILAGSGVTCLARIRGNDGQLVTIESISTITYQVSNLSTGAVAGSGSLTPSAVVFDALQQADPRWTRDSAAQLGSDGAYGYNFAATIAAADFGTSTLQPPGLNAATPAKYQIDVVFTPVSGQPFRVSFQVTALPVFA